MAKANKSKQAAIPEGEMLRLTHAQIVNDTCTYSYDVRLENGETDSMTNACGRQFHNDLRMAFKAFEGHLAVITEQVDAEEVSDIDESEGHEQLTTEKLLQHSVTEVKLIGNLETGSIQLTGIKALKSNEELKLKTPKVGLDTDYEFSQELIGAAQNLINEVTQYHNGKSRPEAQTNMFEGATMTVGEEA